MVIFWRAERKQSYATNSEWNFFAFRIVNEQLYASVWIGERNEQLNSLHKLER